MLEPDYAYGTGELRLRVEHVDRAYPIDYHGETRYLVQGMQLSTAGTELGRREVLVRGRQLPPAGSDRGGH